MKELQNRAQFSHKIETVELGGGASFLGPAGAELFFVGEKKASLPAEVLSDEHILEQAQKRRELHLTLMGIFDSIPDVNMPIQEAVKNGLVKEEKVRQIYEQLGDFIEADENNARIVLYLPFQILPDLTNKSAKSNAVLNSERKFIDIYTSAWLELLDESDVRASFVDGDVLEPGMGAPKRVRKAGHLIPDLVKKGIFTIEEIEVLIKQIRDEEVRQALSEGLVVAKDRWPRTTISTLEGDVSIAEILSHLDTELEVVDERFASNRPEVIKVSPERVRWEKQMRKNQIIDQCAQTLNLKLQKGEITFDDLKQLRKQRKPDRASAKLALKSMILVVESMSHENPVLAKNIAQEQKQYLKGLWQGDSIDLRNSVISGLAHWYSLGIVDSSVLNEFGIRIPDFASPIAIDLKKMVKEDCQPLISAVKKIEINPNLMKYFYPMFLVFGSKVKGYAINSDLDAAIFVRPDVPWEKREEILKALREQAPEVYRIDKMAECWVAQNSEGVNLREPENNIFTVVSSEQIHFFLGGVWIGQGDEWKQLRSKLVSRYLNLEKLGRQKNGARRHLLRRLEMDNLQYRLMHKGYDIFKPSKRIAGSEHSALIDWNSAFWDEGYRRIATLGFLSKVFLPDLSSE